MKGFSRMQENDEDRARVVTGVCGYHAREEERRFFSIERKKRGGREENGGAEESVAGAN